MSNFSGLAGFTIEQLGVTGLTTGEVVSWFKYNLGTLNSLFMVSYQPSGEFTNPPIDYAASGFYSKLYTCNYYNKKAQESVGAAAYDWSEIKEGDSSVRRVSKNEQAKTFLALSKECKIEVNDWASQYRASRCIPASYSQYYIELNRYTMNIDNT